MFKILDISNCPAVPMERDRGETVALVNQESGTEDIDVHLNRLRPGGPRGNLHKHTRSCNIYIVRSGEGELVVGGQVATIKKDQVVYIPAGVPHSLSNVSKEDFELIEIYAPAGKQHDFVIV